MIKFDPFIHHRHSTRLNNYDYSQQGLYFITICCKDGFSFFGEIKEGEMYLSKIGEIAYNEWLKTELIRDNIKLYSFVIMPNHFHAIVEILYQNTTYTNKNTFGSPSNTIGSIVRGYKGATSHLVNDNNLWGNLPNLEFYRSSNSSVFTEKTPTLWQRNYHDHIIRNYDSFKKITDYIINNPKNWDKDCFYR